MITTLLKDFVFKLRVTIASRFLTRIKRATHRMPVRLVEVRKSRVLVIAPHPDDEVIGCGGALLLHLRAESTVRVIFVSDGSVGIRDPKTAKMISDRRFDEVKRVKDFMKFESFRRLDFPDASLVMHEKEIAARLASEVSEFKPDQIYCPHPADGHADHQACSLAVAQAINATHWSGTTMCYELWATLSPNAAIDITSVADQKDAAIRLYESQIADRDYASAILGLNHYRGLQHRLKYAEAYYSCNSSEFQKIASMLNLV